MSLCLMDVETTATTSEEEEASETTIPPPVEGGVPHPSPFPCFPPRHPPFLALSFPLSLLLSLSLYPPLSVYMPVCPSLKRMARLLPPPLRRRRRRRLRPPSPRPSQEGYRLLRSLSRSLPPSTSSTLPLSRSLSLPLSPFLPVHVSVCFSPTRMSRPLSPL